MNDTEIKAILAQSVSKVSAQLSGFTTDQLTLLHDAEEKAEVPRTSLLAAIHKAQQALLPPAPPPAPSEPPVADTSQVIDPEARAEPRSAGALVLDVEASEQAAALQYHGGAVVVLVDDQDVPLSGWPPLEFAADQFEAVPAGFRLNADIDMGIELPPGAVSAAWMIVGDKPMAVARLSVPLPAGGGRRAQLPSGGLRFRTDG